MSDDSDKKNQGHRDRLRRRFLSNSDAFEDAELLELLLTYAIPRRDVALIAHELLEKFTDLSRIVAASAEELIEVKGVGESGLILFF